MENKEKLSRRFLGKTSDFVDKKERDHEKKHLNGYLRGGDNFIDGYKRTSQGLIPNIFKVQQEYFTINN